MSMHSVGSIRNSRSGEEPHVYMIGDRRDVESHVSVQQFKDYYILQYK